MASVSFDGLQHSAYGIGPVAQSRAKLETLIKANDSQYSVLFGSRKFHNHMSHHMICAYFLGATPQQLTDIFNATVDALPPAPLTPWEKVESDVLTDSDWKTCLSDRTSDRKLFEYITSKIQVEDDGDWHDRVRALLLEDELKKGLPGGLFHPLIHLSHAMEINNEYAAIEALTLACTEFVDIKVSDGCEKVSKSGVLDVFAEFIADPAVIETLKDSYEDTLENPLLTEYYANRLDCSDKKEFIKGMLQIGASTLTARVDENDQPIFDFFLTHILTSSHALAELIFSNTLVLPEEEIDGIIRKLWVAWLSLFSRINLPRLHRERITNYPIESVEDAWKKSVYIALNGHKRFDVHFVKAIRALLFAETFTGDKTGFYAKAALRLAETFDDFDFFPINMVI